MISFTSETPFVKAPLEALDSSFEMASRSIAANCRKVVCIGRNYAYERSSSPSNLSQPPASPICAPKID